MKITRREFIKISSLYGLGLLPALTRDRPGYLHAPTANTPNIIILLFDALSARHMSLYGYRRDTTPYMTQFAQTATVYHRHYAAGNFTSPATASLLTGTYPWTHRAFQQAGLIHRKLANQNLFQLLSGSHQTAAFAQNLWADLVLYQFEKSINVHIKSTAYSLDENIHYNDGVWQNDALIAFRAYEDFLEQDYGIPGSLYFSLIDKLKSYFANQVSFKEIRKDYPRGIPTFIKYKLYFVLEQLFDGVAEELSELHEPYASYFHLWPPHEPYVPHRRFIGLFEDGWAPTRKQRHPLAASISDEALNQSRRHYDEYIANVDAEFGRLYEKLQTEGVLDNSYLIITSDHGEMFERGAGGHVTPLLYEPVIHVPLLISAPGQSTREDIYSPTSCVDVLPTVLKITGGSAPEWLDGSVLPGFGIESATHPPVFAIEAKKNPSVARVTNGTLAMMDGDYKLIWYIGYPGYDDVCELYNVRDDPEELVDLSRSNPEILKSMKSAIQVRLEHADRPFQGTN